MSDNIIPFSKAEHDRQPNPERRLLVVDVTTMYFSETENCDTLTVSNGYETLIPSFYSMHLADMWPEETQLLKIKSLISQIENLRDEIACGEGNETTSITINRLNLEITTLVWELLSASRDFKSYLASSGGTYVITEVTSLTIDLDVPNCPANLKVKCALV